MTEEELVQQLQHHETQREAFAYLVDRYGERLYWQIRRMVLRHEDADDLLQNTFMKAWSHLDNFRGEAKLSTWLYKIALHEAITFLKRERRNVQLSLEEHDLFLLERLQGDDYFDGDAAQLKLQEAILRLPEKQRIVFLMRYEKEMSYQAMSEILGTSVGALKASYFHAAKKIQAFLTKDL